MVPVDKTGEDVTLNLNARFFWEDVPFGLVILKDIGRLVGVATPTTDKMIAFHQKFMPVKYMDEETNQFVNSAALQASGAPSVYGIQRVEDLVSTSLTSDKKTYKLFRAKL